MRIRQFLAIGLLFSGALFAQAEGPAPVLKTVDGNELSPEQIGAFLAGPGIAIGNVKLTGAKTAIGTFSGGNPAGIGFEEGVIMASGEIADAAGPNVSQGTSGTLNTAGDADLDKLIEPNKTKDATVLEFDFVTESEDFGIKYVFASEEYKEFVGSSFNDVFAFLINGKNIALIPNTNVPVAINNVNHELNQAFYRDNPPDGGPFLVEYDGLTTVLSAKAVVVPGQTYHIKLAVADASDSILDSAVFLAKGGITGSAPTTLVLDPNEVFLGNSQSINVKLSAFDLPKKGNLTLSASGLPDDSTVTFSPAQISSSSSTSTMRINIGPTTLPNDYLLVVSAMDEKGKESITTMIVHVECLPPFILGLPGNQPGSQSVAAGQTATLRVVPQGSGPFRYQWYQGGSGSTFFPIGGATSAQFTTGKIVTPANFWVRVSNPCGTVDSDAALISPR